MNVTRALETDRAVLLEICETLDGQRWSAESGCLGWSVKDLVAHMAALFWAVVDPSVLPDTTGLPTEEAAEVHVRARRSMRPDDVLEDYVSVSEKAIGVLAGFAEADFEVPLGDLGTYPASAIPDAYCFDHYTHIRADLFAPRGPLTGPVPASDELRLVPVLDWIEEALPQQNQGVVEALLGAAEIVVTGPAGRTLRLGPPDVSVSASLRSDADGCVRWITQRATWEEIDVQAHGDTRVLGDLRRLKVF